MATHSSILDWAIPWREEPAGLQSMGSQRLGNYTPITTTIAMTVNIEHLWYAYVLCTLFCGVFQLLASPSHIFQLSCLFSYYWVLRVFIDPKPKSFLRYMICKYFLSFSRLPFYSVDSNFRATKFLNFHEVQFVCFFCCCLYLSCHIQEIIARNTIMKLLLYVFIWAFCNFRSNV